MPKTNQPTNQPTNQDALSPSVSSRPNVPAIQLFEPWVDYEYFTLSRCGLLTRYLNINSSYI